MPSDVFPPFPHCPVPQKADLFRMYHLGSLSLASSWVCVTGCVGRKWEDKKRRNVIYWFLQLPPSHQGWAVTASPTKGHNCCSYWTLVIDSPNLAHVNPRVGNVILLLLVSLLLVPGGLHPLLVPYLGLLLCKSFLL